ncbi:hypothetical protein [Cupriavidus sp. AU9028]|uniref:hypothetical protein n=1 Tax=Cupriavidus sp. AU9028 TaxID=2871157 RepID=UPI001C9850A5|nr:hypothetical protein [Cupriavidus sp. AU9028]MBY4899062.1 hypothetical protein [Cupriavidus sp. AU9028]
MTVPAIRLATLCLGMLPAMLAAAAQDQGATVQVSNLSTTTTCAEEDNVSFALSAPGIQAFRVAAVHPPYIGSIRKDSSAPDFSGCNFGDTPHPTDPRHAFTPRKVRLYDGKDLAIVGITFDSFWRPQRVPVRVGAREDNGGFHLIQFFDKRVVARPGGGGANGTRVVETEVLVLYPSDGYWRAKPLPAPHLPDNAYGSSFLMGPVVQDLRPIVEISRIDIDPLAKSVRVGFERGGEARIALAEVSRLRTTLDVSFDPPLPPSPAKAAKAVKAEKGTEAAGADPRTAVPANTFAMLRSMYVTEDNADMSRVQWRDAAGQPGDLPLPQVSTLQATEARFGRTLPSRHNTSAPDIAFERFSGQ